MLRQLLSQGKRVSTSAPLFRASNPYFLPAAGAHMDWARGFSSFTDVKKLRNIGISAHIDSGKTTLTERILFYTGRINAIHEVRGKDGVGAKMDSMALEREKGITIQSAATFCDWKDNHINIIDTPGHVDFTIEVERSLRVLDGAVLVLCGVAGVQSQSITVDRQMKRYNVPRVAFINKLDRLGANPATVLDGLREKLHLNAAFVQLAIGLEKDHVGVVDLVRMVSLYNDGPSGEDIREGPIPHDMMEEAEQARAVLVEKVSETDDDLAEVFLMEETPTAEQLSAAIRRATIALGFVPVFCGSAFKNKGVQQLLDGVCAYLPAPSETQHKALDTANGEEEVLLTAAPSDPLLCLAFKLEEGRFGQLTYVRVYQGELKKGDTIYNAKNGEKVKVPRLVRMHSDEMTDVEVVRAGEIVALFGVDCHSGDTFGERGNPLVMSSMFVPEAVMSLSVKPKNSGDSKAFGKALGRFSREDPTFRVSTDPDSKETIISGMGELHLEIYVERMKREYNCEVQTGMPQVNYNETVSMSAPFNYLHKKQSGGSGQYARVIGRIEPLEEGCKDSFQYENRVIGNAIAPEYSAAVEKGFMEAMERGSLIGHPVTGVRVILEDGATHAVDSSEMAFRAAAVQAFRQAFHAAGPKALEPIMKVEVEAPSEFQGSVLGGLSKRKGLVQGSDTRDGYAVVQATVPLAQMFGYSTHLRSSTQGKGEFSMEYLQHQPVMRDAQEALVKLWHKKQEEEAAKDK